MWAAAATVSCLTAVLLWEAPVGLRQGWTGLPLVAVVLLLVLALSGRGFLGLKLGPVVVLRAVLYGVSRKMPMVLEGSRSMMASILVEK